MQAHYISPLNGWKLGKQSPTGKYIVHVQILRALKWLIIFCGLVTQIVLITEILNVYIEPLIDSLNLLQKPLEL